MGRTVVELDDRLVEAAQALAERQGKSLSEVIGTAVETYVSEQSRPRRLSFTGIGASSGPAITIEEQDEMLRQGLDPVEGWSPDRSALVATYQESGSKSHD